MKIFTGSDYAAVILAGLLIVQNSANSAENEFQQWSTVSYKYGINDKYFINLLGQGRFALSDDRSNLYVIRPSLHYNFTKALTGGIGYDYLFNSPGNDEQRMWQELLFKSSAGITLLINRFRLEERFITGTPVIYRSRYNLKATRPLAADRWSLVGSNEIFFNLNSRGTGPYPGFDQNRLFTGLGYKTGTNSRIEFGYMWRYLNRRDNENINDHAIVFNLFIE